METVPIRCPYCGAGFDLPGPEDIERFHEIECLPYTRSPFSDEGSWGQIGQDFYSRVLGWERIGILRFVPGIKIMYRAARCLNCGELFDVYARCSGESTLADIWPHLLGRREGTAPPEDDIALYSGLTAGLRVIRWLADRLFGDVLITAFFMGVMIWLFCSSPIIVSLIRTTRDATVVQAKYLGELLLRSVGAFLLALLLYQFENYVRFLQVEEGFYRLFRVRERRGVTYWKNYSLSRIVGVQKGRWPSITQVDITGGMSSLLLLLIAWFKYLFQNFRGPLGSRYISLLLLGLIASWFLGSVGENLWKSKGGQKHGGRCSTFAVLPIRAGGLIGIWVVLLAFALSLLIHLPYDLLLNALLGFVFWALVVYHVGKAVWLSFNTSVYVLQGLTKIPMNLNPLEDFKGIEYATKIGEISVTSSLIVFLFGIIFAAWGALGQLVPGLAISDEMGTVLWLLDWGRWGLFLAIIVISFFHRSRLLIVLGLFYLAIMIAPPAIFQAYIKLPFLPSLMAFGLFFSYLVYLNYTLCRAPIVSLRQKYRELWRAKYEREISHVQEELDRAPLPDHEGVLEISTLIRRYVLLAHLQHLVAIREVIVAKPVKISLSLGALARIFAPFILSIAAEWGQRFVIAILAAPLR